MTRLARRGQCGMYQLHRSLTRGSVQEHLCVIEAQGSLGLIARAHVLLAESYLRTLTGAQLPPFRPDIEHSLAKAVTSCSRAEWWPQGRKAATLLAMARRVCGDEDGCQEAAKVALEFEECMQQTRSSAVV
jgi:hypothetical protein